MNKKLNHQIRFESEIFQMKKVISNLNDEIKYYKSSIEKVNYSKAYQVKRILKKIKFYLLLPFFILKISNYLLKSIKKLHREMIIRKYVTKLPQVKLTKKYKISIVIPTYYAEPFMSPLLKAISAQDYLEDVDLIIIDSESNDNTQKIAREFGAHVLTIKQKDFTHSKARNIASKLAKHEFLLFTVQDALPSDTTTFAKMAEILSKDENMAAVSTVQHARPDADIYARWQVNNHNELLDLTYDSISKVSDFSKFNQESFILKRRVSLLDDVCALYRKDTFDELNGFSEVGFGEDLDYAFKALRAGHSLGLLCSSGVIHSHNRPAHYFLKRTFISSYLDLDLLLDVDKKKIINPSIDLQAGLIIAEYLNSNDFNFQDNFFVNIRNFVYGWIYLHNDCDPTSALGQAIALIIRETKMSNKQLKREEIINYYKNLMDILRSYLMSHPINIFNDENKRQFLERMLATQIGDILARYCLGRQTPTVAKNKKILTKLLSGNV